MICDFCPKRDHGRHAQNCPKNPRRVEPLPVVTRNENFFVQVDLKSPRAMEALRKYLDRRKK